MAWLFLLVSVCLLGTGLVLGQKECDFTELNQGLNVKSWDAGANYLAHLPNMSDERECQNACCMKEDCQLALIETPADGSPQCFVVNCLKDGKNVCVLEPSEHSKAYLKSQVSNSSTDNCRFEKVVGHCRAYFPRFYYDVTEQTCKTFVYGGCGGNANNFKSKDECEAACSGVTGDVITDTSSSFPKFRKPLPQDIAAESSKAPLPEMTSEDFAVKCQAEPQVGLCRASIPRYYYSDGTCKRFRYGGCGGNSNNYNTEEECMETCTVKIGDSKKRPDIDHVEYQACLAPSESGPCRAAFQMYYFEPNTQSCEMFIYGGCKGNKNRYSTLEECMSKCAGKDGGFEEHGFHKARWTPAFFLVSALAVMSVVLLVGLLLVAMRRVKHQRLLLLDDKQELLPEEHLPVEDAYNGVIS